MVRPKAKYWGLIGGALAVSMLALGQNASAQYGDLSPVLLVESGPSDNPNYERMIFVKFLSGDRVSVNYKAYNRTEFIQIANTTPMSVIRACSNGPATSLGDIQAFERENAQRKRRGQKPRVARFCIKNIQGWEAGNRDRYLDPIFNGMPHASYVN